MKALQQQVTAVGGSYDLPVPAGVSAVKTTPGGYQKVGRIEIPGRRSGRGPPGEGVYAKALETGPGRWPGTPLPGEAGNSVLSGRRNTHTQPFKELDRLKHGDKILVGVGKDDPVTFRVVNTTMSPKPSSRTSCCVSPRTHGLDRSRCSPAIRRAAPIFRIVVRAIASS
ncbi:MAG: sortase [Hymenobacter sp.]